MSISWRGKDKEGSVHNVALEGLFISVFVRAGIIALLAVFLWKVLTRGSAF